MEAEARPSRESSRGRDERELNLRDISCVFGYARSTNEYKIVRIYYRRSTRKGHVEVHTLGSGHGWREKGTIPNGFNTPPGASIFANGAIYWEGKENIVAFGLADEEFQLLPFPPCMSNCRRNYDKHGLVALGGKLSFYLEKSRMGIWSLKKRCSENSDTEEIWCLDFDIGFEGVDRNRTWFRPILTTENEEVIFTYNDEALYCYDSKTTTLKMISDEDEVSTEYFANVEAIPHINTLASLEAMGEKSKKYLVDGVWKGNEFEELEGASLV